jgi:hypothetical protein
VCDDDDYDNDDDDVEEVEENEKDDDGGGDSCGICEVSLLSSSFLLFKIDDLLVYKFLLGPCYFPVAAARVLPALFLPFFLID